MQSSNDYLSLTTSPSVRQNFLSRIQTSSHILGSTGSRLLSGSTSQHAHLEYRFSEFFDSPSALLFNSGWDANVSFFATVPQSQDWVVYDELVHASVHSGLRASRVHLSQRVAFKHNDPKDFQRVLEDIKNQTRDQGSQGTVFVALESLYSMDGDFAPLPALLDILDQNIPRERQCVVLDEAHSTGVYGSEGRGVVHALEEQARVGVRLMTFGKAVGCSGGQSPFRYLPFPELLSFVRLILRLHSGPSVFTYHQIILDQLRTTVHLLHSYLSYFIIGTT